MRCSLHSLLFFAIGLTALSLLSGCTGLSPQRFADASPVLDPIAYFTGPVRAWGVIESRGGAPRSRFRADLIGHLQGDTLVLTQDFDFDDGRKQRRVWHLRRIDAHRFDATASDVIGVATGYAYGNSFKWDYTLQLKPGNPLTRVRMHHWMYLTGDGRTLINRVTIRKLGMQVGGTTEYFQKGNAAMPGFGSRDDTP